MKVSTKNEYGKLNSIIVGSIENGAWPTDDKFFNEMIDSSTYQTKLIKGKIPKEVIEQTEKELQAFVSILESNDVTVIRPKINKEHWCISARDILLTVGNKIIECPTPYSSRKHETQFYQHLQIKFGEWIKLPAPQTNNSPMFDAANVCKLDDKLLYLVSKTANKAGAKLLQQIVGTEFEVILWEDVYSHAHIDSTLISLGKDTVLLNGSRVNENNLPKFMQSYKKIYVNDMEEQTFYHFPFASKWIGMNILSIDPETVIVDPFYRKLIDLLKDQKYNVITTPLTHSRTLGGGLHCVTCDLERE